MRFSDVKLKLFEAKCCVIFNQLRLNPEKCADSTFETPFTLLRLKGFALTIIDFPSNQLRVI